MHIINIKSFSDLLLVLPWHWIWIKFLGRIVFGEQLHADDSEYVDNYDQNEREVAKSADRRDYNAKQHFHCSPRLSQF